MRRRRVIRLTFLACTLFLLPLMRASGADEPPKPAGAPAPATGPAGGEIRLVVREDDMGVAQAVNEACVQCYREGIARSVEVIVPGPWFLDAVRLLKENPGLDVGVHLCLTSEWARVKWRPITRGASLVDGDGYFFPMTSQRRDFPPNTGFLQANPKPEEVEQELRAQIETLKRHLGDRVTHVSAHMGAATATPELRAITSKLAAEYKLRFENAGVKSAGGFGTNTFTPEQREQALVAMLERLTPGQWLVLEHPGLDTPEMRALGHKGYENVAADRVGVTKAFTSEKVKKVIADRHIRVMSYGELKD
jgi:chitin disaccharide deacetylase